jgi:M6 family metalloprotease-like protein
MWRICVVLLSVGLLAGCASSGRSEQVAVLGADVADLRERMNELQEQVAELTAYREVAACRLPNRAGADRLSAGFPISPERIPASGNVNVAVLFVDFQEAPALQGETDTADKQTLTHEIFVNIVSDAKRYLKVMSYGTFDVTFRPLHRWLRMPHSLSSLYADSDSSLGRGISRFMLIDDAIGLADPEFDFEDIDSVVVIAAPEADSIRRGSALLSPDWHFDPDGQTIGNAISLGSNDRRWADGLTVAHELGHNLGLPDLYDVSVSVRKDSEENLSDEVNRFVGVFGLMGARPSYARTEMFAWSRWQLGWLRDTQVTCITSFPTSVQLTSLAIPGGVKAVVVPLTETTALVVESRRILGYDSHLSKEGALVYKVDTSVPTGEGPIVVGSISKPPDDTALLGPGEAWNSDGYSVTVKEVTPAGDLVEISTID